MSYQIRASVADGLRTAVDAGAAASVNALLTDLLLPDEIEMRLLEHFGIDFEPELG